MLERTLAITALLIATACGPGADTNQVVEQDSAGISIIETPVPRWHESEAWRIDPEPALQIGVVDGDSTKQFFRVFSAVRLSDGRIVTADMTTNRLRFFGANGEYLGSAGRQGSGPGEFEGLFEIVRLPNDSLLAWDGRLRRATLLDGDGNLVATFNLVQPGPEPIAGVSPLRDGRIVSATGWSSAQMKPPIEPGLLRAPSPVFVFDARGEKADTLGMFPGMDMAVTSNDGRISMGPPPFGHVLSVVTRGDRVFVGTGDTWEVREYTPSGELVRILRGPAADLALDAEAVQRFKQASLDILPDAAIREREASRLSTIPLPETRAAFSRLLADPSGNLWLSPYESFAYSESEWTVVGQDGAFLGAVEAPPGLRILDIGDDYVLGRWQDESQVEFIRLHRLIKP